MDLLNQLNLVRDNIVVVEPEEEDYNIVKNCRRSADKRKMDRSSRPTVFSRIVSVRFFFDEPPLSDGRLFRHPYHLHAAGPTIL